MVRRVKIAIGVLCPRRSRDTLLNSLGAEIGSWPRRWRYVSVRDRFGLFYLGVSDGGVAMVADGEDVGMASMVLIRRYRYSRVVSSGCRAREFFDRRAIRCVMVDVDD